MMKHVQTGISPPEALHAAYAAGEALLQPQEQSTEGMGKPCEAKAPHVTVDGPSWLQTQRRGHRV